MKNLICLLIGILLIITIGCTDNKIITVEPPELPVDNPGTSLDMTSEIIDFSNKENWETAYEFMYKVGKPVKYTNKNYFDWHFIDGIDGDFYFDEPISGVHVGIVPVESIDYYFAHGVDGDEVCNSVRGPMSLFFPDSEWPTSILETDVYLESYIGLDFELHPNEKSRGYRRILVLDQNKCTIIIDSNDEIITRDAYFQVYGDVDIVI
jgi:hypothetical protein